MKVKTCTKCGYHGSMWQSKPLLCKNCIERKPIRASTSHDKVKVDTNTTEGKKVSTRKPISPISDNQKERLKNYRKVRDAYMKLHPVCEFPYCNNPSTELHHGAGKVGDLLFDDRYFKALDHIHHRFVEENPLKAQELGLSFKRLDK